MATTREEAAPTFETWKLRLEQAGPDQLPAEIERFTQNSIWFRRGGRNIGFLFHRALELSRPSNLAACALQPSCRRQKIRHRFESFIEMKIRDPMHDMTCLNALLLLRWRN